MAGGTPGRFALVEVIASPWARIRRCSAGCDRPAHGDAAFRPAQTLGHAPLAAGQHERQRSGPVARGEIRGVARQLQVEPLEHVAAGDEQQKRLSLSAGP